MAQRLLFQVSYNGKPFYGWQTQVAHQHSVQSTLAEAFQKRFAQKITVVGGSRTDRGVHARGQLATADVPDAPLSLSRVQVELNQLLRPHIAIRWIQRVHPEFRLHHRIRSKVYHYYCYSDRNHMPFWNDYALWTPQAILDNSQLSQYAKMFEGTHDFKIFSNTGTNPKSTVRTLYRVSTRPWRHLIIFRFHGDGFLKQMIRNLMGTLMDAVLKQRDPASMACYFELPQRPPSIITAPPQGLTLFRTIL